MIHRYALAVAALAALAACGGDKAASDPTGTLTGRVTLLGAPISGATVRLNGGAADTTDANGDYAFAGVGGGVHSLGFTATEAAADSIPEVYYSPDTGAEVPASFTYDALYLLGTFDLQVATRLASVNVRSPARSVTIAPLLSPDGLLYLYGVSNSFGLTDLYVGSTAGGAPVLITDDAYNAASVRFAPDSSYVAFTRYNQWAVSGAQLELWVATIGPGPTVSTLTKVRDFQGSFLEFSPHTNAGAAKSIYLIAWDPALGVYKLVEQNINGGAVNEWPGVTQFWVAKKTKRVLFYQAIPDNADADTLPQYRFVSVAASGASVGTAAVTYEGGTANPNALAISFHGFSPDEDRFAYTLYNPAAAGTLGLKSASVSSSPAVTMEAVVAGSVPACVSWNPAGDRLLWAYGGALRTSPALTSAPASYVAATTSFSCPAFTPGAQTWLYYLNGGNFEAALAPADASTAPVPFATIPSAEHRSSYVGTNGIAWIRGASSPYELYARNLSSPVTDIGPIEDASLLYWAPSGLGGLYRKQANLYDVSYSYVTRSLALGGAAPTSQQVGDVAAGVAASPTDQGTLVFNEYEEGGGFATLTSVDTATGASQRLLRRVSVGSARIQEVGATPTPRITAFRVNSPLPFDFQDGVYVSDP
jgi:hypothetical protein